MPSSSKPPSKKIPWKWGLNFKNSSVRLEGRRSTLVGKHLSGFYSCVCSFVVIVLHHIKYEPAYFGEEFSVVPKEYSQHFGQRNLNQSVGKTEQKVMRNILCKEQGAFLGTGRAKMEAFASRRSTPVGEGSKELFFTFRISAWFWFHPPAGMKTPAGTYGTLAGICDLRPVCNRHIR